MSYGRFGHQAWDEDDVLISDGFGNAKTLERYAELYWEHLKKGAYDEETGEYVDPEKCGWTVWLQEDNNVYLEFKGRHLVEKGGDVTVPKLA